jgi:hypothetical protein
VSLGRLPTGGNDFFVLGLEADFINALTYDEAGLTS